MTGKLYIVIVICCTLITLYCAALSAGHALEANVLVAAVSVLGTVATFALKE